jgi:DNA-binding MarR family transcriptional regulator
MGSIEMSDTVYQSRVLPRQHKKTLEKIRGKAVVFDGRSEKIIEALAAVEFVVVKTHIDEKNQRKVKVSLTERGKNALERSRRGVDPYLVMTK